MSDREKSVVVDRPVTVVYNQWTQFASTGVARLKLDATTSSSSSGDWVLSAIRTRYVRSNTAPTPSSTL